MGGRRFVSRFDELGALVGENGIEYRDCRAAGYAEERVDAHCAELVDDCGRRGANGPRDRNGRARRTHDDRSLVGGRNGRTKGRTHANSVVRASWRNFVQTIAINAGARGEQRSRSRRSASNGSRRTQPDQLDAAFDGQTVANELARSAEARDSSVWRVVGSGVHIFRSYEAGARDFSRGWHRPFPPKPKQSALPPITSAATRIELTANRDPPFYGCGVS